MTPLKIVSQDEAAVMNNCVLHCGSVSQGDAWDTEAAWADPATRQLARRVLLRYRTCGELPSEDERRLLATCCA